MALRFLSTKEVSERLGVTRTHQYISCRNLTYIWHY